MTKKNSGIMVAIGILVACIACVNASCHAIGVSLISGHSRSFDAHCCSFGGKRPSGSPTGGYFYIYRAGGPDVAPAEW